MLKICSVDKNKIQRFTNDKRRMTNYELRRNQFHKSPDLIKMVLKAEYIEINKIICKLLV